MFDDMPDRRAAYALIGVVTMGFIHVASMALLGEGTIARLAELTFYGSIAVLGVVVGLLSYREGFCLMKPSHTRSDTPFSFWFDVAFLVFGFPAAALHLALSAS